MRTVRTEELAHNAEVQGARLRQGLDQIARDREFIGDVRGKGLVVGVDLVQDRDMRSPPRTMQRNSSTAPSSWDL